MPPQSFALQLEGLRLGEKALANSERYGVPRCISALPDRSILILEWIDGTSLADCLVSHATTLDTKLMMIGHAAEWLYEFHKLTRTGSELPDIDKRLGKLERSVEKVSKNHYIPKMIREAHRFLLDTARIAEKTKCTVSLTHGDFKPQNVIICEDKTFGIDPYSSHTGLALIDVAHFLWRNYYIWIHGSWAKNWDLVASLQTGRSLPLALFCSCRRSAKFYYELVAGRGFHHNMVLRCRAVSSTPIILLYNFEKP